MQTTYLKSAKNITAIRNRSSILSQHSHQEKRNTSGPPPVEFKNNILQSDTPKLIFSQDIGPMNYPQQPITPQHEENVRFVREEWDKVHSELNSSDSSQQRKGCVLYVEKNEYVTPEGFQAFDLEEFWGEKFLSTVMDKKSP